MPLIPGVKYYRRAARPPRWSSAAGDACGFWAALRAAPAAGLAGCDAVGGQAAGAVPMGRRLVLPPRRRRLCASDPRCDMELDEVDPQRWAALEAATEEYVAAPDTQAQFAEAAAALLQVPPGTAVWARVGWQGRRSSGVAGGGTTAGWPQAAEPGVNLSCRSAATNTNLCTRAPHRLQAEAASAAQPTQGSIKLGARRKLVVLRAPRLGAHQLGVEDAVAASLAYRPGCVAAVNLQQLVPPPPAAPAGSALQQPALEVAAGRTSCEVQQPPAEPAGGGWPGEPPRGDGGQPQQGTDGEGSGLSAYLSSWFGSPTKQTKPLPAPVGGDPEQQQRQPPGSLATDPGAASLGASPRRPAALVAAAEGAGPPAASDLVAAAGPGAAAEEMAAKLEERLAQLLPTVGVVHLGLELAGSAGLVLRWRQELQVLAEPSESACSRKACLMRGLFGWCCKQAIRTLSSVWYAGEQATTSPAPSLPATAAAGDPASALLREAGHDPATTRLVDLFSQQPSVQLPGGRTATVLSSQTQWASGEPLSMLLLSVAGPDLLLSASSLCMLGPLLRRQAVVCTAALPAEYVDALLALGASSVICRAAAGDAVAAAPTAVDCCSFFATFYDALLAGTPVADSLLAAEEQFSDLRGVFQFR